MVNKKGYVKTIEAIIAIVIILIVSYTAVIRNVEPPPDIPSVVEASQNVIIQNLNIDEEVRNDIINCDFDMPPTCDPGYLEIGDILESNAPPGYTYAFRICDSPNCICIDDCVVASNEAYPSSGEVFMSDTFVSSDIPDKTHKIVRFWMWRP